MERVRDDKEVNETDVRISQLEVRCYIENLNAKAEVVSLPKSEILKRNVYIKVSKGITSVRKVVMWKTNKEVEDENFPPFVVHYTDYSPTRKKPLNRDVEVATNEADATAIFDEYDKNGAKRGWNPA